MKRREAVVRLLASLSPPLAAGLALVLAGQWAFLAPRGSFPAPGLFAAALVCAAAAAAHRPLGGGGFGLGTMVLPAALHTLGPAPAAWIAGGAMLASELTRRFVARFGSNPPPERRHLIRSLEAPSETALATLAAGMAWAWIERGGAAGSRLLAAGIAGTVVYLLAAAGLAFVDRALFQGGKRRLEMEDLAPLAVDLAGWGIGLAVGIVARDARPALAWVLLGCLAALALEAARNARLLDLSEQRIYDLEKVSRAGLRMIASGHGMASIAERIRVECRNVVPFLWYQFELLEGEDEPRLWSAGPGGMLREGPARPEGRPPALPGVHKRTDWRVLAYPLKAEGQILARLRLWCDPRRLVPSDRELLETLLPQLAASVHRALLDRAAKHDPLTGLALRRVLERRLQQAYALCLEDGGAMAVVMCDLDHFKRINDTHGHTVGDQALVAVARVLGAPETAADLCCRYGGEEFTLLLEGRGGTEALAFAERLRRRVAALDFSAEGKRIPLTVSAGVAAFPELHIKTAAELLLLADGALYEAKRQGRDRCLLDLGQGSYRTAGGEVVRARDERPAEIPRIFA